MVRALVDVPGVSVSQWLHARGRLSVRMRDSRGTWRERVRGMGGGRGGRGGQGERGEQSGQGGQGGQWRRRGWGQDRLRGRERGVHHGQAADDSDTSEAGESDEAEEIARAIAAVQAYEAQQSLEAFEVGAE